MVCIGSNALIHECWINSAGFGLQPLVDLESRRATGQAQIARFSWVTCGLVPLLEQAGAVEIQTVIAIGPAIPVMAPTID